jgi:hypothetical protein
MTTTLGVDYEVDAPPGFVFGASLPQVEVATGSVRA